MGKGGDDDAQARGEGASNEGREKKRVGAGQCERRTDEGRERREEGEEKMT